MNIDQAIPIVTHSHSGAVLRVYQRGVVTVELTLSRREALSLSADLLASVLDAPCQLETI